ncbi:beta-propeller fold lactonase family protein [Microlunatus aurantiacus]|uniref:Beta-propeller fold lactonase family protein n=1 Tax=Microlunatus aurantiacus TaxID=446786 RepID=A0ABP7DQB3_9ACTN
MSSTSALRHVFVGGYSAESDGHATGVTSLLNTGSARRVRLEPASTLPLISPTWLTHHPSRPLLLAAGENSPGTVSSLRYDPDGSLVLLSTVEIAGDGACHVAVTPDGAHAIVASYRSGSLSTVAIGDNGTLSAVVDTVELSGSGPVSDRQEGAHAHQAVVVGDEVLCCDLGGDQIFRLRISDDGLLLSTDDPIRLPAGSGPRHLVHAQDHLVVACELSGELWVLTRDGADWRTSTGVATSGRDGHVQPSGIATDGTRIYVANRGVDTIGVFDLDPAAHTLTPVTEFDCGGAWPRDITLDGGLLWVCNQNSDTVAVFEASPMPPATEAVLVNVPSPTGVVLVHDDQPTDAADDRADA